VTIVSGVDPGLDGAISAVDLQAQRVLWVEDMPTLTKSVGKKNRRTIDLHRLRLCLQTLADIGCELVTLEEPGYRQGQKGAGTVGQGYGLLLMGCFMVDPALRTETAGSGGWKASMKVSSNKETSMRRVGGLFPEQASLFYGPLGGAKDGRAEAVLMALYGAQKWLGIHGKG
jgi:hypothetical protein